MRSRLARMNPRPLDEARAYARKRSRSIIVISFTTDPYPPEEVDRRLTRRVLEILAEAPQHRILVLTKNPRLALRDMDLMLQHGDTWLGTTLTSLSDPNPLEPKAPPASKRLAALRAAKRDGVRTWLSLEPIVPGVTDVAAIVEATYSFVDFYVLGAFNYASQLGFREPEPKEYEPVLDGIWLLDALGKEFFVKKELRKILSKLGW